MILPKPRRRARFPCPLPNCYDVMQTTRAKGCVTLRRRVRNRVRNHAAWYHPELGSREVSLLADAVCEEMGL